MQNKIPHVIVCDDDAELNSFIRNHFKLDGYETHQALSAQECIDKLAELGDTIDAITVNGKRMNRNVKVFVLADRNLSEHKTRIMDYGADEFAVKPLSMESLINKVNIKLLESAKSAAGLVNNSSRGVLSYTHWKIVLGFQPKIEVHNLSRGI